MFAGASPKLTFVFGVISGVAATALIALILFMSTGTSAGKGKSVVANTNTGTEQPTFGDVRAVSDDDIIRGNKDADIKLIAYTDLECPYCKRFHPVMQEVLKEYGDKVAWVYRQFPLSFHANAQKEGEAALCVSKLGGDDAYWDFIDQLFNRTTSNGTGFALENLPALAKEVGVNEAKFKSCLDGGEMASRVSDEMADGSQGGATGTPTTFIVGKDDKTITGIPGAYTFEQVKATLDQVLSS